MAKLARLLSVFGSGPQISRIVFTGDVFRTHAGEANQLQNVLLIEKKFGPIIRSTANCESEIRFRGPFPVNPDAVTAGSLFSAMDESPAIDAWARTFWKEPSDRVIDLLRDDYAGALVVGFELSPLMEGILDRLSTPWISLNLSPIRFMEDLLFSFRVSRHFAFPMKHSVSESEILAGVQQVKAYYASMRTADLKNTLVFFAQTLHDRTAIVGDTFADVRSVIDNISNSLQGKRLLIKPHPLSLDSEIVRACVNSLDGLITDRNTYAILSAEEDVTIATLSSSVGIEAPYFQKKAHVFHREIQSWTFSGPTTYRATLSSDLWRELLSNITRARPTSTPKWRPNEFRKLIGGYGLDPKVWSN